MKTPETRSIKTLVRAIPATANTPKRIAGSIPFNSPSELLCDETGITRQDIAALRAAGGCFREVIAPGAFNYSDVRALVEHQNWPILGRTSSRTFRLNQGVDGLGYELDLPESPAGQDLFAAVDRGDIQGVSFGFAIRDGGEDWDFSQMPPVRTLRAIDISEISFVGTPAYSDTTAATRTMIAARDRAGNADATSDPSALIEEAEADLSSAVDSEFESELERAVRRVAEDPQEMNEIIATMTARERFALVESIALDAKDPELFRATRKFRIRNGLM
ncbi:MAG TPA: HK97 family phage prohead protease [Phycisphaerae bacterium]|nr:HK97 family phage prohead protease [Phycisphaerae bacterium]